MGAFERNGYAICDLVLTASACETIAAELPDAEARRGGVRNLIGLPIVMRLLRDSRFASAVCEFVDRPLVAVKATLFDKTPDANWRVQWHQDRIIAVRERIDAPGFGRWTVKDGVPHVEPPDDVLASMVAVRVHLDDSGPESGPLRVIPGSHRRGKIAEEAIAEIVASSPQTMLTVPRGAILLMRPLLLHEPSAADQATHRRVLHIELAPPGLIAPLQWASTAPLV